MTTFAIKKGDTRPYLRIGIIDSDSAVYDITGASAKFIMREKNSTTNKINSTANITDEANGYVEYRWQTGDTDTIGLYIGEFQITETDGGIFTLPTRDRLLIRIISDMGD